MTDDPVLRPTVADPVATSAARLHAVWRSRVTAGSAVSLGLAAAAAAIAGLPLIGWLSGTIALTRLVPGLPAMEPTSALCMVVLALTWLVPRQAAMGLSVAMALVGAAVLTEYTAGGAQRLEGLLVSTGTDHPDGRVSILSAVAVIVLAVARLAAPAHADARPNGWTDNRRRIAQGAGLLVLAFDVPALLTFLFHRGMLTALGTSVATSLPGVLAVGLLATAVLFEVPRGVLRWMLTGKDLGGILLRRVIPVSFSVLLVLGYLRVLGEHRGWYGTEVGAVIMLSGCLATIAAVTYFAAQRLVSADRVRAEAVDTLHAITAGVDKRSDADALAASRHALELDRDRERIAADLHDLVIQRLFAIGLSLDAGGSSGPSEQTLSNAVHGIDTAIRDLRGTIFNLRSAAAEVSVVRTLSDMRLVCQAAGFDADIEVDGSADTLPTPVRVHLAAVVRESVSNAVRHSGGTTVTLRIVCSDTDVTMRCADDGTGFDDETDAPSGLRNIRTRAQDLGGQATWAANAPRGTVVTWHVPLEEPRDTTALQAPNRADETARAASIALRDSARRPLADRVFALAQVLRDRLGADAVALIVESSANRDNLVLTHCEGLPRTTVGMRFHRDSSLVTPALESGRCITGERLASASAASAPLIVLPGGPGLIAPVPVPTPSGAVDVAIVLLRESGSAAFDREDVGEVEAATRVAVTTLAAPVTPAA